jgi:hypothetical protein
LREEDRVGVAVPTCFAAVLPPWGSTAAVDRELAVGRRRKKSPEGGGKESSVTGTQREGGVASCREPPPPHSAAVAAPTGAFAHLHLGSLAHQPVSSQPKSGETRPPLLVWHTGAI